MKNLLLPLLLLCTLNLSYSQEKPEADPILVKKHTHLAEKSFKEKNFSKAIVNYLALDSLMPGSPEIQYNIGVCFLNSNYKHKSLPYFETAKKKKIPNLEINYMLGQAYHYNHKFDLAKKSFQQYLKDIKKDTAFFNSVSPEINRRIQVCDFAKELVEDSIPVEIENIGKGINTEGDEYVPIVSADQQTMYFTSRRKTQFAQKISHDGKYFEDIFYSEKDSTGKWGTAKEAPHPINGQDHDACIGITADAQTLFLYRTKSADPFKGSIFMTKLNGKEWTKPSKLGSHVNTKKGWESSISIAENNQRLYFSSDRPGGYGGLDIWYCELQPNKEWGEAKNLGPSVNTKYDEDCPFIHFDDKTLFFSSTGHNTMGGFDVFSTVLNADGTWSKPRNIGYPINSADDDMYFVYSADGSKGYLSTSLRPDCQGERDIYVVNRPKHSKQMIVLRGKVLDEESNAPVQADITVTDLQNNEVLGVYRSNSSSGKYVLALDFGKNYSIQFEAPGFIFHSENVNINNPEAIFTDNKIFKLKHIKAGNSLVLNNIFFDKDKYDLKSESLPELDKLLDFMIKHPHIYIEISGHTDSLGNDVHNMKLSKSRAQSVMDYLSARNIPKKNIRIKGYGESRPVASNGTEEGRKLNRRTECLIYDMDALPKEQLDHLAKLDTNNIDDLQMDQIVPEKKAGSLLHPKVHFLYNNGEFLTDFSKSQLDRIGIALKRDPKMKIEIVGSIDRVGNEHNNKTLYEKRTHTVLHYFLEKGFTSERFTIRPYKPSAESKITDLNLGNADLRKVEFVLTAF